MPIYLHNLTPTRDTLEEWLQVRMERITYEELLSYHVDMAVMGASAKKTPIKTFQRCLN